MAQSYVTLTVTPDTGLNLVFDSMEATEELGRPFLIALDVSSDKPTGDLHAILGSSATVKLSHPKKADRFFNGIVARIAYRGLTGGAYHYRLELRPWIWLLGQTQDCRIFSQKSPWDIITGLFSEAGFSDYADKRQNGAGSATLDYCVQYRETSLDFVARLMEQHGLYYFIKHADGLHTINFADDPNSHSAVSDSIPYSYEETNWQSIDDHIWAWSADAQIRPGAYTLREYNFTTPKADLTAKSLIPGGHEHGTSEVYDYPGIYDTAAAGQTVAQIRMQDLESRRQVFGGASNSRSLGAGLKFTMTDFPDGSANREYLITSSVCTVDSAESYGDQDGELVDTFRCIMQVVPGSRVFRLPDTTPCPHIRGPQTAVVTGESGQEITTDQYGRIKVQFPWDRKGANDENSSCWIRVAQIWAGAAWGAMFIPRIGQEVVVEFLEGNPDRPLVTGQVYNADMTAPYGLPDNKTRSTIKSNSSQGGGGFNEFRFEDKKDSEEVFLQAQKDYNIVVLNNETDTVTQDQTTTVQKGNRLVTVQKGNDTKTVSEGNRVATIDKGNDSITVSKGDRSVTVSTGKDTLLVSTGDREVTVSTGNDTLTVSAGNHKIDVSAGTSTITAATSITLKVAGSSIKIEAAGITISAPKVTITADAAFEASGLTSKVAGQTSLTLDGGAMAKLSAAIVQIN